MGFLIHKMGCKWPGTQQPGKRAAVTSRATGQSGAAGTGCLANVIVLPSSTGWGQADGQQPGEQGQPGNGQEQAMSTGQEITTNAL